MAKAPEVSDIVDAKCGKCKDVRRHTVMAVVDGTIVKVQCNTCSAQHKFRPASTEKKAAKKAAPRKKAPTKSAKAQLAALKVFEEFEASVDPKETPKYSTKTSFAQGSALMHPTFGLGRVELVIPPNKMDVLFRDGLKRMLCTVE